MTGPGADICIIGAGSSGIAVAKALHDKGLNFDIYEKGSNIGEMWRHGNDNGLSCAYRSLHIDTSRLCRSVWRTNPHPLAVQRLWRRLDEDHSSRKARSLCADQ